MSNERINKQFYQPLQPAVSAKGQDIVYLETDPEPHLRKLIYCYWELKTTRPLKKSFHYNVVSDGCFDIFFDITNPSKNFLMGFATTSTRFPLSTDFHYAGVRFLPAVFPQLYKINASEITNNIYPLNDINPHISTFISGGFEKQPSLKEIKDVFDRYLLNFLRHNEISTDYRINQSLDHIFKSNGNLTLKNDLDIGISSRQLRRLFNKYIGGSVKTFSKIVRFQNALKATVSGATLQKPMQFSGGYYDQAHFIKEFKTFYGTTPGSVVRS